MEVKKQFFRLIFTVFCFVSSIAFTQENDFSKRVKIALRQTGNELLLIHKDSSSLILPVKEIDANTFQIRFQKELSFEPSELVFILKNNLEKSLLPENYIVEVLQCSANEVAYSYEINQDTRKTIIPCSGRVLPKGCYRIEVNFLDQKTSSNLWMLIILIPLFVILIWIVLTKRKSFTKDLKLSNEFKEIGSFTFYPHQNKLVKKAEEITLSKKECELLEIFVAKPNMVIKREELTKKVWEDNGVIVGRSLDTYISKLRKKLQEDDSIKLTNIHGVGYKLELK